MKKILLIVSIMIFIACICEATSFNRIIYPIGTRDASGYTLRQERAPARIISADPAITEILFALNLKDKIVGVSDDSDWPKDIKKIERIGRDRLDIKKLIKLAPDLVIVSLDKQRSNLDDLRKIKFNVTSSNETREVTLEVFAVDPKNLSEIFQVIDVIGTITNREHAAYSLTQRMRRQIDWVTSRAMKENRMKALVIMSKRPIMVASDGILSDISKAAGLVNIAARGHSLKLGRDEIMKLNPDIIITSTDVARNPKDIYNNRSFRKTGAGKNKKVVCVDQKLLRPGPRITEALDEIASVAYGWPREKERGEGREIEQTKE
jgi:iron complex transport system substrate-binding protein